MMLDPIYFIFALPGFIFALLASFYVKATFARYAKIGVRSGITGAQAAQEMLQRSGVHNVRIERVSGFLSDHYDPGARVLRLSPDVYDSSSLSAIGVACHEAGHALQHAHNYAFLNMRTALVPMANIGSSLSYPLFFVGLIFSSMALIKIGILMFSAALLFTIVTLPVEWNASSRAKRAMVSCGLVTPSEASASGSVLNAAFMTYVASAVSSLLTLLYFLFRSGLLGGRRD